MKKLFYNIGPELLSSLLLGVGAGLVSQSVVTGAIVALVAAVFAALICFFLSKGEKAFTEKMEFIRTIPLRLEETTNVSKTALDKLASFTDYVQKRYNQKRLAFRVPLLLFAFIYACIGGLCCSLKYVSYSSSLPVLLGVIVTAVILVCEFLTLRKEQQKWR